MPDDLKNPPIGTKACEFCGATVTIRKKVTGRRVYWNCCGEHELKRCSRGTYPGENESAAIMAKLETETDDEQEPEADPAEPARDRPEAEPGERAPERSGGGYGLGEW